MLHKIIKATAHPNHTVSVKWSDRLEAAVHFAPLVAKGNVFGPLQDRPISSRKCTPWTIGAALNGRTWPIYQPMACASALFPRKPRRSILLS